MPSTDPPIPITPSTISTDLSALSWSSVTTDPGGVQIGRFHTTLGASVHTCPSNLSPGIGWLFTGSPSTGTGGMLMRQATADVLKSGTRNADGSMTYGGTTYDIKLYFDGANFTARAVAR